MTTINLITGTLIKLVEVASSIVVLLFILGVDVDERYLWALVLVMLAYTKKD